MFVVFFNVCYVENSIIGGGDDCIVGIICVLFVNDSRVDFSFKYNVVKVVLFGFYEDVVDGFYCLVCDGIGSDVFVYSVIVRCGWVVGMVVY